MLDSSCCSEAVTCGQREVLYVVSVNLLASAQDNRAQRISTAYGISIFFKEMRFAAASFKGCSDASKTTALEGIFCSAAVDLRIHRLSQMLNIYEEENRPNSSTLANLC